MLLIGGWLCDQLKDYLFIMKIAVFLLFVWSFASYYIMYIVHIIDKQMVFWPLALNDLVTGIALGLFGGAMELFMVDSINDVVVTYTVIGIAYNVCQAMFGGTAPLIGSALSMLKFYYVGAYLSACSLLSLIVLHGVSVCRRKGNGERGDVSERNSIVNEIVVVTPDVYS